MKKRFLFFVFLFLNVFGIAQTTLYVNPDLANSETADGTLENPFNDIALTVDLVANAGGGEVIVIDGEYDMTGKKVLITTAATESTSVTIKPQSIAGVKLTFTENYGFDFDTDSRYIRLEGFEIYGKTDQSDYWTIVARSFWGDETIARNGGLAVILDGQNITIKDNYIHDWYQKAVEIKDGRYVIAQGNVIHDIATTSLSGGHGIMRQQKGLEFFDNDIEGVYRWDINENMIFNVEQRIYSWVPSKGFIDMVIEEGKSILIDEPKDTDGVQEHMTARIKNNIVAFGSIDHIRLKNTPNLEVSNNSIYVDVPKADGISDVLGTSAVAKFTNFKCINNASQSLAEVFAFEIDNAVEETVNAGGTPVVSGNYAMNGKIKPSDQTGITRLEGDQLFIDPAGGNFRINPDLNLPATTGVEASVLDALDQKVSYFGVVFDREGFEVDHLKLSQTILDNIPGLNDGIEGNDTVFADYGVMSSDYHTITFDVVDGYWKDNRNSPNQQNFNLNPEYTVWYQNIATTYLNSSNSEYERIRWGNSEVMQNQVFDPDWLTVCQIKAESNTLINGYDRDFKLDGDILIDFEDFTPQEGDKFDLIKAKSIKSANTENLFDRVIFEGYTPDNYTLSIESDEGSQVLRLSINSPLGKESLLFDTKKIKISPNPAKYSFDLQTNSEIRNFQIFDISGKDVSGNVNISTTNVGYRFNTENLKSGIYILKTKNESVKFVIQK